MVLAAFRAWRSGRRACPERVEGRAANYNTVSQGEKGGVGGPGFILSIIDTRNGSGDPPSETDKGR